MPKSATSLLGSTEVTHATIRRAVEAALTAVLQERKRRPVKPPSPPPSKDGRKVVKTAAGPTKRPRKRGFRGTPPPLENFSIANLSDDGLLTEYEVAAVARLSTNTLSTWRKRPDHPLQWTAIGGGRIRYRVAAVKQYLATGHRPQPGRPRKKQDTEIQSAAPSHRRAARPR